MPNEYLCIVQQFVYYLYYRFFHNTLLPTPIDECFLTTALLIHFLPLLSSNVAIMLVFATVCGHGNVSRLVNLKKGQNEYQWSIILVGINSFSLPCICFVRLS